MSDEKKAKRKKRDTVKYPGLEKSVNSKTRQDLIDFDYVDKLSDSEKEWLNRFSKEYIGASFEKTTKNYSRKNLHKTGKQRRECYSRNNARNRCAQTIAQATGFLVNEEVAWDVFEQQKIANPQDQENAMIALVEAKGSEEGSKKRKKRKKKASS